MTTRFILEGGRYYLATALFDAYRFRIRCEICKGNDQQPGFIKDQAGKAGSQGQARRQWACQRSNGPRVTSKCPRVSCTEYIELAQRQLTPQEFRQVWEKVCEDHPPVNEEFALLQAYRPKRKASPGGEPPTKRLQRSQPEITTPIVKRPGTWKRVEPETPSIRKSHEMLTALVEMSSTWAHQLELLTIFLASSSAVSPASPSTLSMEEERVIPSTYPEELGTSQMSGGLLMRHVQGLKGARSLSMAAAARAASAKPQESEPYSSSWERYLPLHASPQMSNPSSPRSSAPPSTMSKTPSQATTTVPNTPQANPSSSPIAKSSEQVGSTVSLASSPPVLSLATRLAQRFHAAGKAERQAIRQEARNKKVYLGFQQALATARPPPEP